MVLRIRDVLIAARVVGDTARIRQARNSSRGIVSGVTNHAGASSRADRTARRDREDALTTERPYDPQQGKPERTRPTECPAVPAHPNPKPIRGKGDCSYCGAPGLHALLFRFSSCRGFVLSNKRLGLEKPTLNPIHETRHLSGG